MTCDVGDWRQPYLDVSPHDGTTTVALTVTSPSGVTTTPAVTPSVTAGRYDAATYQFTAAGVWIETWTVTGTGAGVEVRQLRVVQARQMYATLDEIRDRVGITDPTDTADDVRLTSALMAAVHGINTVCGRVFSDAGTASARLYYPDRPDLAEVDDFHTTTGLVIEIDTGGDGSYATTWTVSDYELQPLNGVVDGEVGWPYWKIKAVRASLPMGAHRAPLRVTARWGWAAVPDPVHEACLIVATEIGKLKDAPFGVAGFGEYGAIRVRQNPIAMGMLARYRRDPVLVG